MYYLCNANVSNILTKKFVKSHSANLFMASFSHLEPLCPGSSPNLQRKKKSGICDSFDIVVCSKYLKGNKCHSFWTIIYPANFCQKNLHIWQTNRNISSFNVRRIMYARPTPQRRMFYAPGISACQAFVKFKADKSLNICPNFQIQNIWQIKIETRFDVHCKSLRTN